MNNLDFDTGRISYEVNGVPDAVAFNPADASFADKLLEFFETFNKKHIAMSDEVQKLEDKRKIFSLFNNMDKDIRAHIDDIFGENTSEKIFGITSTCAMAGGLPIWMNFSLSVMEEIQNACDAQKSMTNPKLEQLLRKYRKS